MRKLFGVWLFLTLFVGCIPSPPPFEYGLCVYECNKCGLDCNTICGQLQVGIDSEACHDASQNVWLCAVQAGCNFSTTCAEEVDTFLTCTP